MRHVYILRHVYKPLRWLLVGFLLLLIIVPLSQTCVLGVLQGEGCKWQPAWSFFTTHWVWIGLALLLLVVLLFVSWWAERVYQASQRLGQPTSADRLRPEDMGFHVVKSGESEREIIAQSERPFHEDAYLPRKAIPYQSRGRENPRPQYTEEELAGLLRHGEGFVLQGPPTDGKSHTLYEVVSKLDVYEVLSPKPGDVPGDEDIDALMDVLEELEDSEGLFYLGYTLSGLGEYEQAIKSYDMALKIKPDDSDALNNKIVLLLRQKRHLCQGWDKRERLSDGAHCWQSCLNFWAESQEIARR